MARGVLLNEGGILDNFFSMGHDGAYDIIALRWQTWNFASDGNITFRFERKGVLSDEMLPKYYYRDDTIALWKAIYQYTEDVIKNVYGKQNVLVSRDLTF